MFGPDAEELDLTRPSASRHLAFSAGPHHCLAAALARVELQESIAGVLRHVPGIRLADEPGEVPLTSNLFTFYPLSLRVVGGRAEPPRLIASRGTGGGLR